MPFLKGFEYDVFISYSHVDNLGRDAWVTQFHEELEFALAKRIGRHGVAKIWRDKRLEGNQLFDESIKQAVEQSAIFIALTSNGYLESDYCQQELKWFRERSSCDQTGPRIGDRSRILNVLLASIDRAHWPAEYEGMSGYVFHTAQDADDLGEPTHPRLDELRYRGQMKAVADSLYRMLLAFNESAAERQPPPAATSSPAPTGPRVFIADVPDSLASVRKRLVAELERKNIGVEATVPPPYDAAGHAERVKAVSGNIVLGIHLLDQFPGREIDGEPGCSYPQKQVDLIKAERRPQLIWVPKTLDPKTIEDASYREFIERLETGDRKGANYDFVRGAITALAPQVLEKLQQLSAPPPTASPTGRAVLVDTHHKDHRFALDVAKLMLDNKMVPYVIPEEDDPNKNLDAFGASLGQVSSLAIIYGNVSEGWVRQRLGAALQLSVIKNLALKSFCVVLVPPAKPMGHTSFAIGPVAVQLIDNSSSDTVSPAIFEPLLQAMAREGTV